jgi:hypothetical protein
MKTGHNRTLIVAASVKFGYEHSDLGLLWSCESFVLRRVQWVYV